jgi:hypothetical protein
LKCQNYRNRQQISGCQKVKEREQGGGGFGQQKATKRAWMESLPVSWLCGILSAMNDYHREKLVKAHVGSLYFFL